MVKEVGSERVEGLGSRGEDTQTPRGCAAQAPGEGAQLEVSYWEEGPEVRGTKSVRKRGRTVGPRGAGPGGNVGSRGRREGAGRRRAGAGGQARGSVRESRGPGVAGAANGGRRLGGARR